MAQQSTWFVLTVEAIGSDKNTYKTKGQALLYAFATAKKNQDYPGVSTHEIPFLFLLCTYYLQTVTTLPTVPAQKEDLLAQVYTH